MPVTTYIYALVDPRNEKVRYIGKAIEPERRLAGHLRDARRNVRRISCRWIRGLLNAGMSPKMVILEECDGDGCEAECRHIATARANGIRLTNRTDGGEGSVGYNPRKSVVRRIADQIRGRRMSLDEIARRKESLNRPEVRQRISEGVLAHSEANPEWKAKCGETARRNMAAGIGLFSRPPLRGEANKLSVFTDLVVGEMRRMAHAGKTISEIAGQFGGSWSATRAAIVGETWTHVEEPAYEMSSRRKVWEKKAKGRDWCGYFGVVRLKTLGGLDRFVANFDGRIGTYDTPLDAARAFDSVAREQDPNCDCLNFPGEISEKPQSTLPPRKQAMSKRPKSGYFGVFQAGYTKRFEARFGDVVLGRFDCPIEAAKVRDAKAFESLGTLALLNFPV